MLEFLKRFRKYIIVVIVLFYSSLLLYNQEEKSKSVSWYEYLLVFFTAPLQDGLNTVFVGTSNLFSKYFFLVGRYDENLKLRSENLRLLGANYRYKEIEEENKRLRELLNFKKQAEGSELLAAEVISIDSKSEFKTFRINRGKDDGVDEQLPVVTAEGIVGQVLRVYNDYSDVIMISDRYSYVDAIVQRTRSRGVLEGNIKGCTLKYVLRSEKVEKGDFVISSGLDLVFPKGLPLGYVSEIKKEKFGIDQEVHVTPVVDFNKLEEVLVVLKDNSKLEKILVDGK